MKAIVTKYRGATNTRGSRIAASDEDGNRTTIPYPHELSGEDVHRKAALALCEKMGWTGRLTGASLRSGYVFVFTETSDAVIRLLTALTKGGKFRGNPYCNDHLMAVLREIAAERGLTDPCDALSGLPVYEEYAG
ncbi:MAG: hypothetical protein ABSE57_24760 [Bryobacteraceae bacterium]|jgi:hypothetical protein